MIRPGGRECTGTTKEPRPQVPEECSQMGVRGSRGWRRLGGAASSGSEKHESRLGRHGSAFGRGETLGSSSKESRATLSRWLE